jgi:predicted small secreted protein
MKALMLRGYLFIFTAACEECNCQLQEWTMGKKLMAILMIACFAGLAGCNTMSGLGKDIKNGGESLENSADKHK